MNLGNLYIFEICLDHREDANIICKEIIQFNLIFNF